MLRNLFKKRKAIVGGLVILVLVVVLTVVLTAFTNKKELYAGGEYPVQLRINPSKTQYKKSEYVSVDVNIHNVGDFDITLMGACKGYFDAIVDWQFPTLRDQQANRACTDIALPELNPGSKTKIATLELDLSRFDTGRHTLTVVYNYEDPVGVQQARSNEVTMEVLPGDNVSEEGCYRFTEYVVSYCEQVMIRTSHNLSVEENNAVCRNIYDKYIDRHSPRPHPVPALSSTGCNEGKPAVFVFNVPNGQSDFFQDSIEEAKKNEKLCWSTRYDINWLQNQKFLNNGWNGCEY